jgi:hypothetical protein
MNPSTVATVVIASAGVLGLLGAFVTWLVRRGGDERAFAVALQDNTSALKELATEFRTFRDQVVEKLHDMDKRVTLLEITPRPINVTTKLEAPTDVSAPAYRDPGPTAGH